jgi:HlyD family secretion protein
VYIETARKTGVTVLPAQFILWRDEKPGVLVREGKQAIWRDLTLGLSGREIVEVATGLEPGEWVVLSANAMNADIAGRRVTAP